MGLNHLTKIMIAALSAGVYALTAAAALLGDVNGDDEVNVTDVMVTAAHVKGIRALEGESFSAADTDGDGEVTVTDLMRLAAQVKGIRPLGQEVPVEEPPVSANAKKLDVECVLQLPELPTGCEVTSLAALLRYKGYAADKVTLSREYLPKQYFYYSDGELYGADFVHEFAGEPETSYSYGCYAPCIVTAANSYLADMGSAERAHDMTGTELRVLFSEYIDKGQPVMIWITSGGLAESQLTDSWLTPEGKTVQWRSNEHCVLLTGYDLGKGVVYAADPMKGDNTFDMALLEKRFAEFGKQSVSIW
ncbi:C39 family peptidase [Ruminococcus sp.]|uniref:C39 family peptidase n=1 Tax=Ruminococcus sp. TaxID=41978 RepID=UPI0025EF8861|nr:C39 family peptidase [Ruminococcus sp.]MBQ8966890.1 C39 family peptidase [Ruminococcus sp.]